MSAGEIFIASAISIGAILVSVAIDNLARAVREADDGDEAAPAPEHNQE